MSEKTSDAVAALNGYIVGEYNRQQGSLEAHHEQIFSRDPAVLLTVNSLEKYFPLYILAGC
jgi:hypothetical protein